MNRLDPLMEELEMDVEEAIQRYKDAGGTPQGVIAWCANYLEHMVRAQPRKVRDSIKSLVHEHICEMDDADYCQ